MTQTSAQTRLVSPHFADRAQAAAAGALGRQGVGQVALLGIEREVCFVCHGSLRIQGAVPGHGRIVRPSPAPVMFRLPMLL